MLPDDDFAMSWEVDARVREARRRKSPRRCRAPTTLYPRHRPRPRRRGDLLACPRGAEGAPGAEGRRRQARRLQRSHQERGARGVPPSARDRQASWSTPISPAARSTISSASRCRRCCGASCRAAARPAACNRWRCASSASAKPRSRPSRPREYWTDRGRVPRPRPGDRFTARLTHLDGKKLDQLRSRQRGEGARRRRRDPRGRRLRRRLGRAPRRSAATRFRPSPPRPCSRKPRASSASAPAARCGSRSASTRASISTARRSASSPICAPTASRSPAEAIAAARGLIGKISAAATCRPSRASIAARRRTPRRRTRRSGRPTCSRKPGGCRARISTTTSAGSTSWSGSARWRARWPRPCSTRSASISPTPSGTIAARDRLGRRCSTASSSSTRKTATMRRRTRGEPPPAAA